MEYSLYILFGEHDKGQAQEFMGNTGFLAHAAAGAMDAASNAVGMEVGDIYAKKLTDENSVALNGKMITEMTFKTAVGFMTKYQIGADTMEDVASKYLKHTLTVKGNLEMPNILFALGVETAKKKDTSRIWKWANTPLGVANHPEIKKMYYRDVVATVFSTDDRQFRAIHLQDASVGSYEEYFDTNGEGHFTLVITKIINMHPNARIGEFDIEAKGPEFKMTFASVTSDISKAAHSAGKLTDDAANVTEKILGKDNEAVKKMHKAAEGMNKGGDDVKNVLSDGSAFNPDDLSQEIDDHVNFVKETKDLHDGKTDSEETKTETKEKVLDDGATETTVTVTNPDGSKDITITTKSKDGTEKVEKEKKSAPGYKDYDW